MFIRQIHKEHFACAGHWLYTVLSLKACQREPEVKSEITAWETSETWDHIQFNGFLNLVQHSNQLKIQVKHSKMFTPEAKT